MSPNVRPLHEGELSTADHIFRLAFGTFVGLPEPTAFAGDASYIQPRWKVDPTAAFAAEMDGQLVGSIIALNWGSVGTFGPLSVHPQFWSQGIAQCLIEAALDKFSQWGIEQAGLFTFPNSPKHHALYQKFGFYPQYLTFVMGRPVQADPAWRISTYAAAEADVRSHIVQQCTHITDRIYPGLDATREIEAVHTQALGDTVLLWHGDELTAFAVCHCGAGTEGGSGTCYVKFAAVKPSDHAAEHFAQLLNQCDAFAASQQATKLIAGVNTSHTSAYTFMVQQGFRTEIVGVVMQRPNILGYRRPDVYVLDDWR
ncbi:GNAT family N-acetyltransferase [Leptolyngbya sp. AN02str]|uniref:GNAT family N-acetyltransferase n=1 Tax=Leptolyngbya sp. AN02str TaxID=3423363 RepID=UPI003D312B20